MKLKITSILFLLLAAITTEAQIYYVIPAVPGNPGTLNNDPESPVGQGLPASWSTILTGNKNSPAWSPAQTIPFTFEYNNATETQYKVSSSGVLTFDVASGASAPSYTNATLPNASLPDKSVLVWGLRGTGSNDNIVTKTFGSAPNRQHWIMFTSFSFANSGNNGYAYFSIVLEETTNHIYVVDQRKSGNLSLTIGTQVNSSVAYFVPGTPNVPGLAGTSTSNVDNYYYAFYPGPQPTIDASAQQILLASPIAFNQAPYTLQVKIGNYGTNAITSGTLNYRVNGGATQSFPLTGLSIPTMGNATLTHPTTWNPALGTYTVEMWLSNPNGTTDAIPSNDIATKQIVVSNSVGFSDQRLNTSLELYPNPTYNTTHLVIESAAAANQAGISIISITGQIVYQTSANVLQGKNSIALPSAEFAQGLYLVRVTIGSETSIIKLNKL